MKAPCFLPVIALSICAACTSPGRQPVFSSTALPEATSMPAPAHVRVVASFLDRIDSFDVKPDGSVIALATTGGVKLYDLRTYRLLRELNVGEPASSVAWSSDGSRLAVGSSKDYGTPFFVGGDSTNSAKAHLTVWDTATWQIVFEPQFGNEMVNERFRAMVWSPDDHSLAFSTDIGGVTVLDTLTGQVISRQVGFAATVLDLSWSPDGSRLLATSDTAYGIRRWRVSDDVAVRLFDPRAGSSMSLAWSPDGKRLASGHSLGTVCIWTAATNHCDGFIQAHRSGTFGLAWSPGGDQLATGGGVIRLWNANNGELVRSFGEDTAYIYQRIQWLSSGDRMAALEMPLEYPAATVVRLWDPLNGSVLAEFDGFEPSE